MIRTSQPQREVAIDDALSASFPASDPPPWNPGLARPGPSDTLAVRAAGVPPAARDEALSSTPDVTDVSRPYASSRTPLQALVSLAGAGGIALLVPFVILLVGLPIVLFVRGLLEAFLWLFSGR